MKKILIYLFDGFEMFEYASVTDIFGWNNILNKNKIEFKSISQQSIVKSLWSGEIKVNFCIKNFDFDILKDFDALVIPGGFGNGGFFEEKDNSFFIKILTHFAIKKKIVAGVCSASIILAESNLFLGKKMTTYLLENKRYFNQLKSYNVVPIYEDFVVDDNLITVSGPSNAIELAFYLIEYFYGKSNAIKIKDNMMFKK